MKRQPKEIWKRHPALLRHIEVSNRGRVFASGRLVRFQRDKKTGRVWISERAKKDGDVASFMLARLVGELFCPDFKPHLRVTFRDNDPSNCRADNLVWVSVSERVKINLRIAKEKNTQLQTP